MHSKKKPLKTLLAEQTVEPNQKPQVPSRPHGGSRSTNPRTSSISSSASTGGRVGGSTRNSTVSRTQEQRQAPHADPQRPLGVMLHSCNELLSTYRNTGVEPSDEERQSAWKLFATMFPHEVAQIAQHNREEQQQSSKCNSQCTTLPPIDMNRRSSTMAAVAIPSSPPQAVGIPLDTKLQNIVCSIHSSRADENDTQEMLEKLNNSISVLLQQEIGAESTVYLLYEQSSLFLEASTGLTGLTSGNALIQNVVEYNTLVNRRSFLGVPCPAEPTDKTSSATSSGLSGVLVLTPRDEGTTFDEELSTKCQQVLKTVSKFVGSILCNMEAKMSVETTLHGMKKLLHSFKEAYISDVNDVSEIDTKILKAAAQCVNGENAFVLRDVTLEVDEESKRATAKIPKGLWQLAHDAVKKNNVVAVDVANSSEYFLTTAEARSAMAVPVKMRVVNPPISPVLESASSHSPSSNRNTNTTTPTDEGNSFQPIVATSPQDAIRTDVILIVNKKASSKAATPKAKQPVPIFTEEDATILQHFATLAGPVSEISEKWGDAEHRTRILGQVLGVARSVMDMDILRPEDIATTIMDKAKELLMAENVQLYFVDKERNQLYCSPDEFGELRINMADGLSGYCATRLETVNVADAKKDSRFCNAFEKRVPDLDTRSVLCEPIVHNGDCLAVAVAVNKRNAAGGLGTFTQHDEHLMGFVSIFIAFALHNSSLVSFANTTAREAIDLQRHKSSSALGGSTSGGQTPHASLPYCSSAVKRIEQLIVDEDLITTFMTKQFSIFDLHQFDSVQKTPNKRGTTVAADVAAHIHHNHNHSDSSSSDVAVKLVVELLKRQGYLAKFNCSERTVIRFVLSCRSKYRHVPYHNFFHAVDVFQTVHTFLEEGQAKKHLTPLQCFVLLITALVHDLDHMGLNNSFHLKTDSPLGLLSSASGNESVLEIHHCNVAIQLLELPECSVFDGLSETERRQAFTGLIEAVLATDMAKHKELCDTFKSTFSSVGGEGHLLLHGGVGESQSLSEEQQMLLMRMLIKAADISNVTKQFTVSERWGQSVTEEFYRQGDTEKAKGHEIAPMFDRSLNTELAKGQLGFINFIAQPFFELLVSVAFNGMRWCVDNITANKETWTTKMES